MKKPGGWVTTITAIVLVAAAFLAPVIAARRNQKRGCAYMNSLSRNDVEQLIHRSETLLKQGFRVPDPRNTSDKPKRIYRNKPSSSDPIPKEFMSMGVVDIVVTANAVRYVWMGGMDHTNLLVERDENGSWIVDAYFNDHSPKRRLWP